MKIMKKINWKVSKEENKLITDITKRVIKDHPELYFVNIMMDITATHCNGCELNLSKLSTSDNFNFSHDVFGIINNIDRVTGKLKNCFLPRCSK